MFDNNVRQRQKCECESYFEAIFCVETQNYSLIKKPICLHLLGLIVLSRAAAAAIIHACLTGKAVTCWESQREWHLGISPRDAQTKILTN